MWSIVMRSVVMRSGVMRPVMYLFTVSAKVWLVAILICQKTTKKINKIGSTLSDSQKWRFCKKKKKRHQQQDILKFQKAHPQNWWEFLSKKMNPCLSKVCKPEKKPFAIRHWTHVLVTKWREPHGSRSRMIRKKRKIRPKIRWQLRQCLGFFEVSKDRWLHQRRCLCI